MLRVHKDIIISNLYDLVKGTDLETLVPELLNRNVFNEHMINRILNSSHDPKDQKTELYVEILGRGPQAFEKLQGALESTNHLDLARILKDMDRQTEGQFRRSFSFNSIGSNRSQNSSDDSDGPCLSINRRPFDGDVGSVTFPPAPPAKSTPPAVRSQGHSDEGSSGAVDLRDFRRLTVRDPSDRVSHFPAYITQILDENHGMPSNLMTEDYIAYANKKFLSVKVKHATTWPDQSEDRPPMYKMDSVPRGHALVVNNINFQNSNDYPTRVGADNDAVRFKKLLRQLHMVVQYHEDKTKQEMEKIVKKFSQERYLSEGDLIWVTFMSHGQEGYSSEDSQVLGVDGIGYGTQDIVSNFYNDSCIGGIDKPKIFFFQACRGSLSDPGVLLENADLSERITTDGKKIQTPIRKPNKIRKHSDIFIAYPTVAGISANRDRLTGAWFIQTVVDIFSEKACTTHLEDLLKLVDKKITQVNNLHTVNYQAITTLTMGWNKNLYFNPGLGKDKQTNATIHLTPADEETTSQPDDGMDVVDFSSNSTKSANGVTSYSRLKDDKDDDSNSGGKYDCFNISFCKTS